MSEKLPDFQAQRGRPDRKRPTLRDFQAERGSQSSTQLSAREQEIQRHGLEKVGDYGDGTVYRAPDGSLQFASPTYSTGNPETIQNIMETGKPQGNVPMVEGALRSGFQGISAGTGDEIVAGIASRS